MPTKQLFYSAFVVLYFMQINIAKAQTNPSERYIDRPLTLHKNNLEFAFGYQFGSLINVFDVTAKRLNLSEAGITASNQKIDIQLTYGITERLQIQSSLSYFSYRKTVQSTVVRLYELVENYGLMSSNGFIDPGFKLNYLLLGKDRKFNLSLGAGVSVPICKFKPESPQINAVESDHTKYQFIYRNHNGLGTSVYNLNMGIKYRLGSVTGKNLFSRMMVRLFTDYYTAPAKISTNDWHYVFDDSNLKTPHFESLPCEIKEGDWLYNRLFIDYQAFNITSFMLGVSHRYYFGGWKQMGSMKIAGNDVSETTLLIGSHIQAAHRLRIDELISLPVSGKNTESYFTFQIGLIYKIME